MPDLTKAHSKVFDVLKRIGMARPTSLRLYDDDNTLLATITKGWFPEEVNNETEGEETKQIHITDRTGVDFAAASFFTFGGYVYERISAPARPDGNPREWIWKLRPTGVEVVAATFIVDDAGDFLVDDAGNSLVTA